MLCERVAVGTFRVIRQTSRVVLCLRVEERILRCPKILSRLVHGAYAAAAPLPAALLSPRTDLGLVAVERPGLYEPVIVLVLLEINVRVLREEYAAMKKEAAAS